jgi:hypothetical protein
MEFDEPARCLVLRESGLKAVESSRVSAQSQPRKLNQYKMT